MEFKRLNNRKRPNNKRGIILAILLFIMIYLWYNADKFLLFVFGK